MREPTDIKIRIPVPQPQYQQQQQQQSEYSGIAAAARKQQTQQYLQVIRNLPAASRNFRLLGDFLSLHSKCSAVLTDYLIPLKLLEEADVTKTKYKSYARGYVRHRFPW